MSTSASRVASPGRAFYGAFAAVAAVLALGILVLALVVSTSGPRVRHVVVESRGDEGVGIVDQRLTVFFDRPIRADDPGAAVEVRPKARHTVVRRGQQLGVTFEQNLRSDTEYVLSVGPGLSDGTGREMGDEYRYEFETERPTFTYLMRDYGPGTLDEIVERAPLSGEQRTLFEEDRISRFARNDDYLAVAMPEEDGDELRLAPLGPGESEAVDLPAGSRVEDLEFSPTDDQFVFVTRTEDQPGRLHRYDVAGERLQTVEVPEGEEGFSDVRYSRDGQALLYQALDGTFYLTGATRRTDTTLLGDFEGSGGFDRTNARVSFQTASGGTAIYDAEQEQVLELPLMGAGMDISTPTFLQNSDALVFRQDYVDQRADVTLSEVVIAYPGGQVERQITALYPATFFDTPVVSYDDRYVLIESTLDASEGDGYPSNEQPRDAYLSLYDRSDGQVVEEVRGVDPVWSP